MKGLVEDLEASNSLFRSGPLPEGCCNSTRQLTGQKSPNSFDLFARLTWEFRECFVKKQNRLSLDFFKNKDNGWNGCL